MLSLRSASRPQSSAARVVLLALAGILIGCRATPPDVPGEAARLTGIENAIRFREAPDTIGPAQPAAVRRTLTPAQAIRLALSHDPRIQASLARVRMAEADANQARLLPNPILQIDLRFPVTDSNTAFEPTLTADLITILEKPALISAADHRLRASAANALVTVLDVMGEVQAAYAAARSADAEIQNAQRRRQRLQRQRDLAQRRLEAGEATRLDVLTLDAQLMQSTVEISDFSLQSIEQRLILARLLGEPRGQANWSLAPWEPPRSGSLAPESAWIGAALLHRPEIRSKRWELRALGDELSIVGLTPLQSVSGGVHAEHDPDWRVGPTLSTPLPIFDFGQAARAKVVAERIAARHELAEQQLEVIQNVRVSYAQYVYSRRALAEAQDMLLPLQRQQLEQTQLAFQAGDVDLATLLLAENEFDLTLSKIVELQEKVAVARIALERAVGGAGIAARVDLAAGGAIAAATRPAASEPQTTQPSLPTSASHPATGSAP